MNTVEVGINLQLRITFMNVNEDKTELAESHTDTQLMKEIAAKAWQKHPLGGNSAFHVHDF